MPSKLFLIDGSALYYRSYFALIRNPLFNSKGENTSATFGFLSSMLKVIEDETPEFLAIVFDTKEPTFRHELYADYKATREKMPEEMAAQYPRLIDTLKAFRFNILELPGYEADDIIGTISHRYAGPDLDVFIVSGDKDMAQLVNDHVFLYTPGKSNQPPEIIDSEAVAEKFGVKPEQITDWLSLMGDKSDNIPGAEKVGKKTASKLLSEYGSVDALYGRLDSISSPALRKNLENFREQSTISKQLTTIDTDSPVDTDLDQLRFRLWDMAIVDPILRDLEFRRFFDRMLAISRARTSGNNPDTSAEKDTSEYRLINSESELKELIGNVQRQKCFVFDLETDSLDVQVARIAGIALSWEENRAYYIPMNHPDSNLSEKMVIEHIKPVFSNPGIEKAGQNIKFDAAVLIHNGVPVRGMGFDTMIASYLIDPSGRQHNLDRLARAHLNHEMIPIEDLIGKGKKQKRMTEIPAADVVTYAAEDADITFKLMNIFRRQLSENNLEVLFTDLEIPLVDVLRVMEDNGVRLDLALLSELSSRLGDDIKNIESEILREAGASFNIGSPQQLGKILFEDMAIHKALSKRKPSKTKTGQYSTSEAVLERYSEHPLIDKILTYRHLIKLKNTYVDALPALVNKKTGKIHTSFNQTVAATGRLSSSNPNLQNIPIRTELGREIRKAFIASEPSFHILSADYSQIELRIMAHLSEDKRLIEAFDNNQDIHAATAALIFDVPINEVTADNRRKAKEINFGIMYGMNEYGLSNRLGMSVDDARLFISEYFATYPAIQKYMQKTIRQAMETGYVETMMHRRRYLPEINSSNRQVREFAERTAVNTPIQGSAADIIKKAMIEVHQYIAESGVEARMLLQVHDELVFEVERNTMHTFRKKVKSIMEHAVPLHVPVIVDTGIGENWLEAHE